MNLKKMKKLQFEVWKMLNLQYFEEDILHSKTIGVRNIRKQK